VIITRFSGRITPFVIASRTSATDFPENSSRSAALPAAAPARWPVPAALPARRRAGVFFVWAVERRLVPPEREAVERRLVLPLRDELEALPDREDLARELDERELDDRDEPPEREPPERDDEEREPDEELRELDPLERLPLDPPLLPPDDSAIVVSSSCLRNYAVRAGLSHARRAGDA
jgi:hypothetical protein